MRRLTLGRAEGAAPAVISAAACAGLGLVVIEPYGVRALIFLVAAGAAVAFWVARPHTVVGMLGLVLGAFQLWEQHPLRTGGVTIYASDLAVGLIGLRAISRRKRRPSLGGAGKAARLACGLYALAFFVAGVHGIIDGTRLASAIRLETPIIYGVALALAIGALFREEGYSSTGLLRWLVADGFVFVVWAGAERLTHHRFESAASATGHLGTVITSSGLAYHRDYGLASAFIVYPLLCIAGLSVIAHGRAPRWSWVLLLVGGISTLLTLIRGEIFGLAAGAAVILMMRERGSATRSRALSAALIVAVSIPCALAFYLEAPRVASALVERSLPGLVTQSRSASATADYRVRALSGGIQFAERHPLGTGLVNDSTISNLGIDPGYLAHSGPAALLIYLGWPGLLFGIAALGSLICASFQQPHGDRPWVHALYVGTLVTLSLYTVSAAGLIEQTWVVGMAAIATALRFSNGESSTVAF